MTWTVKTQLPVEFTVRKTKNVLSLSEFNFPRKIVVIDDNVYRLYKHQLGPLDAILVIRSTESRKNWNSVESILNFFEENKILRRSEPIIAIGGGVLLDIVGFACSIYRRGIPYVRVPTTLLAIVDASVGAKTGVDHFSRRNRIGSFYPPVETVIDTSFISTQDSREISNGLAEILKLAIIKDSSLFELIEIHVENLIENKFQDNVEVVDQIIDKSINGMIEELAGNLWEINLERCVDFGHTFSPMIEMKNIKTMLHGEAVILDCLFSSCIAFNRQTISSKDLERIFNIVRRSNLPTIHEDFTDLYLLRKGLDDVTRHRNNSQNLPLPVGIGSYKIIKDLSMEEIKLAKTVMEEYGKKIENSYCM